MSHGGYAYLRAAHSTLEDAGPAQVKVGFKNTERAVGKGLNARLVLPECWNGKVEKIEGFRNKIDSVECIEPGSKVMRCLAQLRIIHFILGCSNRREREEEL